VVGDERSAVWERALGDEDGGGLGPDLSPRPRRPDVGGKRCQPLTLLVVAVLLQIATDGTPMAFQRNHVVRSFDEDH
jgi:hypothetical protein